MVRVGVRDHRAVNGPPGIDKKVTPLTIEAEVGRFEKHTGCESRLSRRGRAEESVPSAASTIATTAPSTASTTSILARLRLVDRQAAAAMVLVVQGVDGREGLGVSSHLDEAESAAPTCLSVHNHLRASHLAEWGEQFFQIGISHRKCEIADKQLLDHLQPPWDLDVPC
jgi:hypothetical protein